MVLHYVKLNGTLIPIAIQLDQKITSESMGVFYPDEGDAWLYAKIAVQLVYSLHHQVDTHLLKTHLCIEVWTIAMNRNLLPDHPLFILLQNHLQKTLAINDQARELLLPEIIDYITSPGMVGAREVADIAYKTWNFTEGHLKTDLIKRGVWDPTKDHNNQPLKNYDYRDFALPLWDSIEELVKGMVDIFYETDTDVLSDVSLQQFADDVVFSGKMHGFPHPITSRDQLIGALTMMMFTTSVQHASINYIQFEYLSYVPNMPLSLQKANVPKTKKDITKEHIFNALPGFQNSASQAATVYALSRPPFLKEEMLDHPMQWQLRSAQAVADRFVNRLGNITIWMEAQNAPRSQVDKYTVLYPRNIPKATSI